MILKAKYIVEQLSEPIRFEQYAMLKLSEVPSKKGIQKLIKRGELLLNGERTYTGTWLKEGDRIEWYEKPSQFEPIEIDMPVVYEDDYLAIVNKPAGIVVSGNKKRTILHALPNLLQKSAQIDALPYPLPVHRLDYATSGLLLIAKTRQSSLLLSDMLKDHQIDKEYRAIVCGKIDDSRTISTPIDDKEALTQYSVERKIESVKFKQLSLLKIKLFTGRTNQIRIHLSQQGNPILGDQKYGTQQHIIKGKGMFLCAALLRFIHPITGEKLEQQIDLPQKYERVMSKR